MSLIVKNGENEKLCVDECSCNGEKDIKGMKEKAATVTFPSMKLFFFAFIFLRVVDG